FYRDEKRNSGRDILGKHSNRLGDADHVTVLIEQRSSAVAWQNIHIALNEVQTILGSIGAHDSLRHRRTELLIEGRSYGIDLASHLRSIQTNRQAIGGDRVELDQRYIPTRIGANDCASGLQSRFEADPDTLGGTHHVLVSKQMTLAVDQK